MTGADGPEASFSTGPQPSTAFTLSGVVNGIGGDDDVQVTADEPTTSSAVVEVDYNGIDANSAPINAVAGETCGASGLPQCSPVNGVLVTLQSLVALTATATSTSPLAGTVADMSQAGATAGATTSDSPCYAVGSASGETCGPVPSGDPAAASATTCTTDSTGQCSLTAMWDGSAESFTSPDTVTLYPPPGYTVTDVTGCTSGSLTASAPAAVCNLQPADGSNPLTVTVDLEPYPQLTVNLAGPWSPAARPRRAPHKAPSTTTTRWTGPR